MAGGKARRVTLDQQRPAAEAAPAAPDHLASGGTTAGLTALAGIGWRHAHQTALLRDKPALGFIEVHAENYFADGGPALAALDAARALYPVSLHGVGLGLGSAVGLDAWHLARLARLASRVEPRHVSDHAAFARAPLRAGAAPRHAADLLPPAFTDASLALMVRHVQQVQDRLQRRLLVENLAAYLHWADSPLAEAEFFNALVQRSGCRLLLDVNNLVVNALNAGHSDPLPVVQRFIHALRPGAVAEIHLAGHRLPPEGQGLVIDDHGSAVPPVVWQAYALALSHIGPVDTLVEWDTRLPPLPTLLAEAERAALLLRQAVAVPAPGGCVGTAGGAAAAAAGEADADAAEAAPSPALGTDIASALAAEAARQHALLAALFSPVTVGRPDAPAAAQGGVPGLNGLGGSADQQALGLAAYRAHARAVAPRALRARYPTVAALVGPAAWRRLSHRHWLSAPPTRGDLAEWGATLPEALTQDTAPAALPYLADVARLDDAVHACALAADGVAMPEQLALLADAPPDALTLRCQPGTALLCTRWPLARLWAAHQPGAAAAAWADAGQALQARQPEATLVWRPGGQWRVDVRAVGRGDAALLAAVLAGAALSQALDDALMTEPGWSFEAWLIQALRDGLLAAVSTRTAASAVAGHAATGERGPA